MSVTIAVIIETFADYLVGCLLDIIGFQTSSFFGDVVLRASNWTSSRIVPCVCLCKSGGSLLGSVEFFAWFWHLFLLTVMRLGLIVVSFN